VGPSKTPNETFSGSRPPSYALRSRLTSTDYRGALTSVFLAVAPFWDTLLMFDCSAPSSDTARSRGWRRSIELLPFLAHSASSPYDYCTNVHYLPREYTLLGNNPSTPWCEGDTSAWGRRCAAPGKRPWAVGHNVCFRTLATAGVCCARPTLVPDWGAMQERRRYGVQNQVARPDARRVASQA
jgi:hypothetical protein